LCSHRSSLLFCEHGVQSSAMVFHLFLRLSVLSSCNAVRTDLRNLQDETQDAKALGFSCPKGLRANATTRVCYFDLDADFGKQSGVQDALADSIFESTGSLVPLSFKEAKYGGGILVEEQFLSEMSAAMESNTMKDKIIRSLMLLEMKENTTFRQEVHKFVQGVHGVAENIKPAEFLFVHAGLHVALEGTAHGLAHLSLHAAEVGIAEIAAVAAGFVPVVGWALFVPMAAYDAYAAHQHYIQKTHHAKNFASRLVMKSDCMEERAAVTPAMASSDFLKKDFVEVCGLEAGTSLAAQVQRSMYHMRMLFEAIEDVGRCIWPHGERRWTKANCAAAIYMPLREKNRKPGLLFEAIAFSASYAALVDDIVATPIYTDLFSEYFGINLPPQASLTASLDTIGQSSAEDKVMACMSVVATHRAYERLFMRFASAVKIWMHTFARDIVHLDVRTRHFGPCRRIFYSFDERDKGMCKNVEFKIGHGKDEREIIESNPCEKARKLTFGEGMSSRGLWPAEEAH